MARGDGRSPSRAEHRRDDHRDIHRKRPRSRSADHRSKRDRDHHREPYRRRSRSPAEIRDRRDDDRSRNDYRDRPRDRAANGYDRDHRRRSPERGERQDRYRDDRPRRSDEYADSHRSRRDDPHESKASSRSAAASQPSEEQIKAERQAKAAAWKAKKESKAKGGPVDAVRGIDARDPGSASPRSPSLSTTGTAIASMPSPDTRSVQTKGFEGKFDPNEIVKKASTSTNASKTLDAGFNVPVAAVNTRTNLPGQSRPQGSGKFANVMAHTTKPKIPLKAKVFDLSKKQGSTNDVDVSSKLAMDFDDEQTTRKKFKKLDSPEPELGAVDVAMDDNDDQGEDDAEGDGNMSGSDNEGDVMSAARAAAQKRSEQMMRNQNEDAADAEEDVKMPDAAPVPIVPDDPLDAFMQDLEGKAPKPEDAGDPLAPEREAIFNEDDHGWDQADEDDPLETRKSKKKKDLPIVDHSKIKYAPFRKSFFTAPAEIAEMTEDEVGALRYELDDIKLHGKNVPRPVTKWAQCGLGSQSLDIISRLGFERPTPIQAQAIPAIMSGRDIIGVATTGSGKTVAFLLPMFRHIKDQKPLEQLDGPVGLVLAPTRELATQIHRECRPWLKSLGLRAVCAYGGAPIKDQIAELKRGAEIVVCTPGRMVDLLFANGGRVTNLRRVTYVVLDEADRMFDMGFEPQIRRITANIRPDRQMVLFSATFPKKMESLARNELKNPCEIQVGGISVVAPEVEQIVEVREESSKFARLLKYLGDIHEDDDARSLVFVNTQEVAEDLASDILKKGYPCNTIHGGRDQFDRDSTISDFKAGIFPVLVATSVAARGLDVKQLKLVVNFDCPNHPEDYVHRCGRTGRAGNKGMAVTFISPEQDRFAELISKALRRSGLSVPDDLQKLVDAYAEKVKAGTAKHMGSTSGFKGKGLERLEKDREVARSRQRKAFGDDDDEEEEKKEEKSDTKKEEIPEVKPAAAAAPAALAGVPAGIDLDNIKVFKSEAASGASTQDRMKGVSDAAAAINARLKKSGDIRGSAPIDNKGPDAGAFHSHIEINDFPQKARWAVTNRSNVSKILETTGTSITNKGNFYPPGQNPGPNDAPKLAILVEGDTELAVSSAMNQITRLLKEGLAAAADSEARAPTGGRYTVV